MMGLVQKWKRALLERAIENAVVAVFGKDGALKNYKTTTVGILGVIAALAAAGKALLDNDPSTVPDWAVLFALITASVGNIVSKDAKS